MADKKRKRLTPAQLVSLEPYEKNMQTAVFSDWTRGIGQTGITVLAQVRDEVTGQKMFVNRSCPFCLLDLVRTVGRWYFEDKAAAAAREAAEIESYTKMSASPAELRKPRKSKKNG